MKRRLGIAGSAAMEAALIAPALLTLFAGVADIGGVLLARFRLSAAASSAASYALQQTGSVNSDDGSLLAQSLVAIARNDGGSNKFDVTVTVNNGPTASVTGTGSTTTGGTAAGADSCYCPTPTPFAFGSAAASCTTSCSGGATAGKFVTIHVSRSYTPIFAGYGIVHEGVITVKMVVQTT